MAAVYDSFLKVVMKLNAARAEKGVELVDLPNFSLGLRVRYTGVSLEEFGERWGKVLASAFGEIAERLSNEAQQGTLTDTRTSRG